MSDKTTKVKLAKLRTYMFGGVTYQKGVIYEVDEDLADTLLGKRDENDEDYFKVVRDKDAEGQKVEKPKKAGDADKTEKSAKTTLQVGGGKVKGGKPKDAPKVSGPIEGLDDSEGGGDGDQAGGDGSDVEV